MGPVDALDALLFQHLVEQAAGAAIAIEDEDRLVIALRARIFSRTPGTMNCGVLCHLAGRHWTSKAVQWLGSMRSTISRAKAPQAISSTWPWPCGELEFLPDEV